MDIVFFQLPEILLSFLVAVKRCEVMAQRLMRLEFIVGSLDCETAGSVIGLWVEFALSKIFKFVE